MNLAISNIAWSETFNDQIYTYLKNTGFKGLEIAPTLIFPQAPYNDLKAARHWSELLQEKYQLIVPSMQSIWYGRTERIFGSEEERATLLDYTQQAIDFASAIHCRNLVFGCPKNRVLTTPADYTLGIDFFRKLAEYAESHGTVIGLEANPAIYGTNYINTTQEALKLLQEVDRPGLKLNLDVGTMVANEESVTLLTGNVQHISHVHISEPYLKPIDKRQLHKELAELLHSEGYTGFVSVEMGNVEDLTVLYEIMTYVREIFG